MSLPLFDKLYGEPNLLTPGEKPVGEVTVTDEGVFAGRVNGIWLFRHDLVDVTGNSETGTLDGTPVYITGERGIMLDMPSGSDRASIPHSDSITFGIKNVTFGIILRINASPVSAPEAFEKQGATRYYQAKISEVDQCSFEGGALGDVGNRFGGLKSFIVGNPFAVGKIAHIQFIRDVSVSPHGTRLIVNGIPQTSLSTTFSDSNADVDDSSIPLKIGGGTGGGDDISVIYFYIINDAVTDQEGWELYNDPYQLLKPVNSGIWLPEIAAVGGVTVAAFMQMKQLSVKSRYM